MEWLNHLSQKTNKVAAITDGELVIKIALFEEFSSKVLKGGLIYDEGT